MLIKTIDSVSFFIRLILFIWCIIILCINNIMIIIKRERERERKSIKYDERGKFAKAKHGNIKIKIKKTKQNDD